MAYLNEKLTVTDDVIFSGVHPVKINSGTTVQRDLITPVEGMYFYNTDVKQFQGYANAAWGSVGGTTELSVTQGAHGFVAGDVLAFVGGVYVKADMDALGTSQVVGLCKASVSAGAFILITEGYLSGLSGSGTGMCSH